MHEEYPIQVDGVYTGSIVGEHSCTGASDRVRASAWVGECVCVGESVYAREGGKERDPRESAKNQKTPFRSKGHTTWTVMIQKEAYSGGASLQMAAGDHVTTRPGPDGLSKSVPSRFVVHLRRLPP